MQSPVTKAVRCQSHRSRWTRLPDAKQDRRNLTDHSEKWIGGRRRSLHSSRWPSATLHPPATADTRRGRDRVFGLVSFKNTWLITWKLRVCRFTPASTASCRCARAIASRAATGPSHPTHTQRVGGGGVVCISDPCTSRRRLVHAWLLRERGVSLRRYGVPVPTSRPVSGHGARRVMHAGSALSRN